MDYEAVIGLEVHAELSTQSKIYCSCQNGFGLEVNSRCCPICMGMPGTLPTLNEKVVEYAIKMGHALNCEIHSVSKQDRKNYFYPDLPKAYQISQFDVPLCEKGYIDVLINGEEKRIGVTRIHIEEDAGKLLHDDSFDGSLVDFNRCGVPLIEIVSEPDMRTSTEAKAYLETIKSFLIYLGISDAKMQEGSVRCDVNVSLMPKGSHVFGTRCEMKNVNTFSGAVRAIEYEIKRQAEVLDNGGTVEQETRRWDDTQGKSIPLRSKEDAHDYRYFPEPDLKTIIVDEQSILKWKEELPELPNKKISRYIRDYGLTQTDAENIVENIEKANLFESTLQLKKVSPKTVSNWILGDVSHWMNETGKPLAESNISPHLLSTLIQKIEIHTISNTAAKTVFETIMKNGGDVEQIIKDKSLAQISDTNELESIVKEVLAANQKSIDDFNNGKTNALGFLVGQCMKASKGKGNPALMKELLLKAIQK